MSGQQQLPTLEYAPPELGDPDPARGFFASLAMSLLSLALVGSLVAALVHLVLTP